MNIFISHANEDSYCMEALQRIILKSKFLYPIVVVRQEKVMEDFVKKVQDGIVNSYYFIPILTEVSYQNQWVNQEIGFALGKNLKVIPIVEKSLIEKLTKGFIHSYRDLPYSFTNSELINKDFRKKFRHVCEKAINNLIVTHEYNETNLKLLAEVFDGHWKTEFDSSIVFKEYGYFVKEKLAFYVDRFKWDKVHNKILFRKLRVHNSNEIFDIELSIRTLNGYYIGKEKFSNDGGRSWGEPYEISFKNLNYHPNNSIGADTSIILGKRDKSKYRI